MSESYYYTGPSIDHTILSPSGRCSTRARKAALSREKAKLFPPGFWDKPPLSQDEMAQQKADSLRRSASNLRTLADRGMNRRKYTREAAKMEAEADSIMKANDNMSRAR